MFLADGFEEVEALCPLDILKRAGIPVRTVGVTGKEVTGSHGIRVTADLGPKEYNGEGLSGIILPGGMPGTLNLDASPMVDEAIYEAYNGGYLVCAICAAPSVLGKRGLLNGVKAVCFPGFESKLEGAILTDARVQRDGNIITAVGMGAAYEFGLEIVAAHKSREEACELAKAFLAPKGLFE